ncbi:uncharacterized protein F4822DRAFT_431703 [Hypoxylon trugodes]|uniref:uncharacterized protein n=1 Tax=Hypoxylon trugodes TaxID=326681 RepID=UPI00218FD6FF|nr:uncharacterized protein F4822DRAFT_431703 [Hypoxylon trugodes]KAI1386835.1 hypothetical protein F4822DRAFT_431703 [Hypoxylon trugodes]
MSYGPGQSPFIMGGFIPDSFWDPVRVPSGPPPGRCPTLGPPMIPPSPCTGNYSTPGSARSAFSRPVTPYNGGRPQCPYANYLARIREHIDCLTGAELRQIILSVCLSSVIQDRGGTYNRVFEIVRNKWLGTGGNATIQQAGEGLGIYLEQLSVDDLEDVICIICDRDTSSSTRALIHNLTNALEDRALLRRSVS